MKGSVSCPFRCHVMLDINSPRYVSRSGTLKSFLISSYSKWWTSRIRRHVPS